MGNLVVGLDIGAAGVKAAWVKRDGHGGYAVIGTAYEALPKGWVEAGAVLEGDGFDNGPYVTDTIRQLWATHKIPGNSVAMSVSDPRSVFVQQASVPWVPPAYFEKAMIGQIRHQKLGGSDPDDADIDNVVLGEERVDGIRKLRVLICTAVSARTERLTNIAAEAGLSVHSVQVGAIANLRGIPLTDSHDPSLADVVVDVGASQVSVLMHQGGVPLHVALRKGLGGDDATESVKIDLSMDSDTRAESAKKSAVLGSSVSDALYAPAQLIAKLVRDSIEEFAKVTVDNQVFAVEGIGSVTIVGGGARLLGLPEAVKQAISDEIDLFPGPFLTEDPADDSPDFTLAVGLAVGALPAQSAKSKNAPDKPDHNRPANTKPPKIKKPKKGAPEPHYDTERADPLELMFQKGER